jgi:hypothetical protein
VDCHNCTEPVPDHERACPTCGIDNGFPNVRLAEKPQEVEALAARLDAAYVSAKARRCETILTDFREAVAHSKAVIARPLGTINQLIDNDRTSYVSFLKQVNEGSRHPEENEFDQVRSQYENALFPFFADKIIFASLSLSDTGMSGYGAYTMVLREDRIGHRASVFEENPHLFVERHQIVMNKPLPPGYRAPWNKRGDLAVAKLHSRLTPSAGSSSYPSLLAGDQGGSGNSDWIEVHIYGSVNRNALERVIGPKPKLRPDRVIWSALVSKLKKLGIEVSET